MLLVQKPVCERNDISSRQDRLRLLQFHVSQRNAKDDSPQGKSGTYDVSPNSRTSRAPATETSLEPSQSEPGTRAQSERRVRARRQRPRQPGARLQKPKKQGGCWLEPGGRLAFDANRSVGARRLGAAAFNRARRTQPNANTPQSQNKPR